MKQARKDGPPKDVFGIKGRPPAWKGAHAAADFLRWLYRQDRLTAVELTQRFRALKRLAVGKLRPKLPENGK